jgi:hypothetical protein
MSNRNMNETLLTEVYFNGKISYNMTKANIKPICTQTILGILQGERSEPAKLRQDRIQASKWRHR